MFKKKIAVRPELYTDEKLYKLIDDNTEIVVIVPWNNAPIPVTIRILDSVSLSSCGEFNTVSFVVADSNKSESQDMEDIVKTKNIHENMLRLALVHPTFAELEAHLLEKDFYKNRKKEIVETEELIKQLTSEEEKEKYRQELHMLELSLAFILPEDFTLSIVTILMQKAATDLNKLTKHTLLEAGFLGEKYNVRPSTYLSGVFTDKQKVDIDVTALTLVADYREQQKVEKNGMRWIRGKNAN